MATLLWTSGVMTMIEIICWKDNTNLYKQKDYFDTNLLQLDSSKTELRIKRYDQKKFEYESEKIPKFENFEKLV